MPSSIENIRHSLAHLLAHAVKEEFSDAKFAIGPVIETGFYYDFDLPRPLTPDDLPKLEKRMKHLIKQGLPFEQLEPDAPAAKASIKNQPFKQELIADLKKEHATITFYKVGDFTDLCRGGHVANTKEIPLNAFALDSIAGAYWRGSEKNPMLTRVYGLAFASKTELTDYLKLREEAKKRDHKVLGPALELFMYHPTAPGMPYWLPNGVRLYNELIAFWREEHERRGYQEITSPLLNKKELYVTSGHFDHYWDNMFVAKTSEDEEYGVKAMNCPNAMIVYGTKMRSYRDLPLRFSDTDTLHRHELSGTLNGLFRVRAFRQDDAHIYVTEEHIEAEYQAVLEIVKRFYELFSLEYSFRLGTRPEKFLGEVATWDRAEAVLERILKASKKPYSIAAKDGAFYGPKIDILMKDALGREWQMGTIQLDFQQPKRFGLTYVDQDGKEKTPVAIHRVIYGSLERFIGILIEHFAGNFPLWLSPVQVAVIPVGSRHEDAANKLAAEFRETGIRTSVDAANETVGKKIRNAVKQKIPYLLVLGDKELNELRLAVRKRGQEEVVSIENKKFIAQLKDAIAKRQLELP